MLRLFLATWLRVAGAFPVLVALAYGLLQAGEATGFEQEHPQQHDHLVAFVNFLLAGIVDHWLGWIIFSALLAFVWTLVVAEPKAHSRIAFQKARQKKLGNRRSR